MDEGTLNINRFEAQGSASFDRWSVSLMYGNYAAQPKLGYLTRREGLLGSASVKVATNWVVSGSARWDLKPTRSINTSSARAMWTTASCWPPTT